MINQLRGSSSEARRPDLVTTVETEHPVQITDVRMRANDAAVIDQIVIVALLMHVDNFDLLERAHVAHQSRPDLLGEVGDLVRLFIDVLLVVQAAVEVARLLILSQPQSERIDDHRNVLVLQIFALDLVDESLPVCESGVCGQQTECL